MKLWVTRDRVEAETERADHYPFALRAIVAAGEADHGLLGMLSDWQSVAQQMTAGAAQALNAWPGWR